MIRLLHIFTAPQSAYFFLKGQLDFMVEKGFEVKVIMPADDEFNPKFKLEQPTIEVININFEREISLKNDFVCFFKLLRVLKISNPDIIHLHTPKASLLGVVASRLLRKKIIIYQMHGLVSAYGNDLRKGLVYYMENLTCALATDIFAVSQSLKTLAIEKKLCKREKIKVMANGTINGIDFKTQFNPSLITMQNSDLLKIANDFFIIGFVGRLHQDKGVLDYVKVLSKLKKENLKTVGFVVGPDESHGNFDLLLEKYDLQAGSDIFLFGQQLNPHNFMVYFDILLLPTKREGFGLVAAEANALEIPVVGYDIPGLRDAVVNGETGILVPFSNQIKLYEAVEMYYNLPNLLVQHGKQGRARVIKKFEPMRVWQAIFNEYKLLLEN